MRPSLVQLLTRARSGVVQNRYYTRVRLKRNKGRYDVTVLSVIWTGDDFSRLRHAFQKAAMARSPLRRLSNFSSRCGHRCMHAATLVANVTTAAAAFLWQANLPSILAIDCAVLLCCLWRHNEWLLCAWRHTLFINKAVVWQLFMEGRGM